jgi:hypothetical protein
MVAMSISGTTLNTDTEVRPRHADAQHSLHLGHVESCTIMTISSTCVQRRRLADRRRRRTR